MRIRWPNEKRDQRCFVLDLQFLAERLECMEHPSLNLVAVVVALTMTKAWLWLFAKEVPPRMAIERHHIMIQAQKKAERCVCCESHGLKQRTATGMTLRFQGRRETTSANEKFCHKVRTRQTRSITMVSFCIYRTSTWHSEVRSFNYRFYT